MKFTSGLYFIIFLFSFMLCANVSYSQELTMFTKTSGFGGYEYYQDDKMIDKATINSLMMENEETAQYWKVATNATNGAIVSGVANLGAFIWFFSEYNDIVDEGNVLESASFWTVIGTGIVTSVFTSRAMKHRKKAILKYNSQLDMSYNFTPSKQGLGIAMNF